jgi:hypothetical protein
MTSICEGKKQREKNISKKYIKIEKKKKKEK